MTHATGAVIAPPERYCLDAQPSRRDAFNGHWERRGLVYIPVPADGPIIKASTEDAAPPAETQPERVELSSSPTPRPVRVGVLCECGCLLKDADELCPACVIPWCLKQEKAFNERRPVIYYRTKQRKDVAA